MLPFIRPALCAIALTAVSACQLGTGTAQRTSAEIQAERIANTLAMVAACRASECGRLDLDRGLLTDYSVVADMTHVTAFMASFTEFSDLSTIAPMTQLRELHIGQSQVTDLSGLRNFPNLTLLHAQGLTVTDFSAVGELRGLEELALGRADLGDMAFLRPLTRLKSLNIEGASVTSLEVLRGHRWLEVLDLPGDLPDDISALLTIPNLRVLSVDEFRLNSEQKAVIATLRERGVDVPVAVAVIVC